MHGIILSKSYIHPFEKLLSPSMLTHPIYHEHNSLQGKGFGLVVVISGFYLWLNLLNAPTHSLVDACQI